MSKRHPTINAPRVTPSVVALLLWVVPGLALAAPPQPPPTRTSSPDEPDAQPKPRAAARRGLDGAATRALRASSTTEGERVAMRTAPAAGEDGESDPPRGGKSKKKPKRTSSKRDDGSGAPGEADDRRISLDEDFLVEGKLEKPNAYFILRRSQSAYDWARLDAKFLPLVLESVQDPLF